MNKSGAQIAALPLRWDKSGKLQVLMVTSRDTGRWVMPKGWTMDGVKPWAAAAIEAMEEAGAEGRISSKMIGEYRYDKVLDDGSRLPCIVQVYPMIVRKLLESWKEKNERERRWFSPKDAASNVDEAELAILLKSLEKKKGLRSRVEELRVEA